MNKYPLTTDFVNAVHNLNCSVRDPVLKGGIPRKTKLGLELYSGGYSRVFPIEVGSKTYALRGWIANVEDAKTRYKEISNFLKTKSLQYFVEFDYVDKGIVIKGNIYPIIRMEWAAGETLKDFIENNLYNPQMLKESADLFLKMVKDLHNCNISHGDLQDGNIIVNYTNRRLQMKLIDYDSMYVPSLSGFLDQIVGLPSYQHPIRISSSNKRKTNEKVDYFSELVIYLSILSFAEKPDLWKIFKSSKAEGFIFTKHDYIDPDNSKAFNILNALSANVQNLTKNLKEFCLQNNLNNLIPLEQLVKSKSIGISKVLSDISKPFYKKKKQTFGAIKPQQPVKPIKPIPIKPVKPIKPIRNFQPTKPIKPVTPIKPIPNFRPTKPIKTVRQIKPIYQSNKTLDELINKILKKEDFINNIISFSYLLFIFFTTVSGTYIINIISQSSIISNETLLISSTKALFYGSLFFGIFLCIKIIYDFDELNVIYASIMIILFSFTGSYLNNIFFKYIHKTISQGFVYWMLSIGVLIGCNKKLKLKFHQIAYHSFIVFLGAFLGETCRFLLYEIFEQTIIKTGIYAFIFYGVLSSVILLFSLHLNKNKIILMTLFISFGALSGDISKYYLINIFGETVSNNGITYGLFYTIICGFLLLGQIIFFK